MLLRIPRELGEGREELEKQKELRAIRTNTYEKTAF
jgi:hypothetical protein